MSVGSHTNRDEKKAQNNRSAPFPPQSSGCPRVGFLFVCLFLIFFHPQIEVVHSGEEP